MTTSLDDLLTAAEQAPRQHRDVDVFLDRGVGERIAELEQQLEDLKGDVRLGDARSQQIRDEIAAVQADAARGIVVIRFRQLAADEWAEIVARCPQRLDVPVDRMYGYNVHDAARAAAPESGVRLIEQEDGADPVEEPLTDEQWERLFAPGVLAGRDFARIVDAIFDLNDWGPQQRLDAARKASRAGTAATSD